MLKLSAFAAREFADCDYKTEVLVDWTGGSIPVAAVVQLLMSQRVEKNQGKRTVKNWCPHHFAELIPHRLWQMLCDASNIDVGITWSSLSKENAQQLALQLTQFCVATSGKATFKEEFTTAGGVCLSNLVMPHMEVKSIPRLYSLGECNNIDGVTGGFNFTSCWSQGWHAANHIASALQNENRK